MEWSRLYSNLPDDPRVQAAEDRDSAGWLLIQSICYCTRAESQGFIPATQVPRFGGSRLKSRVNALVREGLWLVVDGGFVIDPMVWNEERNLSDSAEKKRKADRERIARKRAEAKKAAQNGANMSRDSRATGRATPDATRRRDSRSPEKRREEHSPHTPQPLWPTLVADGKTVKEGDAGKPDQTRDPLGQLVVEIRAVRPDWATVKIRRALTQPSVAERPAELVRLAALAMAKRSDSDHPGRLVGDGPWWAEARAALQQAPEPADPWCGNCNKRTRQIGDDKPRRCPVCHPLRAAS